MGNQKFDSMDEAVKFMQAYGASKTPAPSPTQSALGAAINIVNPAAKGLSAIQDVLRMIGKETAPQVAATPTDYGTSLAGEMLKPDTQFLGAAVRGMGQGALLGQGDRALAYAQSTNDPILRALTLPVNTTHPTYDQALQESIQRREALKQEYPTSYAGGKLLGESVGLPAVISKQILGALGAGVNKIGEALSDSSFGQKGIGKTIADTLGFTSSYKDALDRANSQINEIAPARNQILEQYSKDPTIGVAFPSGKNPMDWKYVKRVADLMDRGGQSDTGQALIQLAAKAQNNEAMTVQEAQTLKEALDGLAFSAKTGELKTSMSADSMYRWANNLRQGIVDAIPNKNDAIRLAQMNSTMSNLYDISRNASQQLTKVLPKGHIIGQITSTVLGHPAGATGLTTLGRGLAGSAETAGRAVGTAANELVTE
jgi:hypothetical protein